MTQIAADALGFPISKVKFELSDSRMPQAPVQGGSMTVASVGSAVHGAALDARAKYQDEHEAVEVTQESSPGEEQKKFSMHVFGAHFVEVRVDPDFGTVRVARVVSGFAAGRIINPKTAHSQAIGGIVGGLGMVLLEEGIRDVRNARMVNANLADYMVPVNLDVPNLDAFFVEEEDKHVNPLGAKGLAELSFVSVAPAVANAVWHATGKRVRDLPITLDKLL
jgi:xanthine dehydrogenase YagR molybdenum-binding subunit